MPCAIMQSTQSSFFSHALRAITFVGKVTLCIPPHSGLHNPQTFSTVKSAFLAFLHLFASLACIVSFSDMILSNSSKELAGPKFSDYLGVCFVDGAITITDSIIRCTGIIFVQDLDSLISSLRSEHKQPKKQSCARYLVVIIPAVLMTYVTASWACGVILIVMRNVYPYEFSLTLIPRHDVLYRVWGIAVTIWSALSTWFAWLFALTAGACLICRLEEYTASCQRLTENLWCYQENLRHDFEEVQAAFESFRRVGGAYCLALLLNCTLLFVRFLSGLSYPGEGHVTPLPGLSLFWYILPCGIITITALGNKMGSAVQRHRHAILDIMSRLPEPCEHQYKELRNLLKWESTWKWKLTALDIFEIKSSLIPAIVTTILTYFIFLFQLKASEAQSI